MKALIHILLTGFFLPAIWVGLFCGLGGLTPHPDTIYFFFGFLLPVLPIAWPCLFISVAGSAVVCFLAGRISSRLSVWFIGASVIGAACGFAIVPYLFPGPLTPLELSPRPWLGAAVGLLVAAIGTYPLHDIWVASRRRSLDKPSGAISDEDDDSLSNDCASPPV